jgi:energy-coupling factor transporter ATP-binding protein EcfA2
MERLIRRISVDKLFGLYSYSLPHHEDFSNAAILYGDNGVGKSTILKLAFHLLSSANDKGHRTFLYKSKFKKISIELSSGHVLTAKLIENGETSKVLTLTISFGDRHIAKWDCIPGKPRHPHSMDEEEFIISPDGKSIQIIGRKKKAKPSGTQFEFYGEHDYIRELKKIVPTMYLLSADRKLDSDAVSDPSDEIELRRMMRFEDAKNINDLVIRSREIALTQALNSATRWISKKAVQSANRGSENVHTVYSSVLKHIITPKSRVSETSEEHAIPDLIKKLNSIENKTEELAKYEFATVLSTLEFRKALSNRSKPKRELAANLLQPYISSLESRLNAIDPIFRLTDRFISITNELLSDKKIQFTLSQGFSMKNAIGEPLQPAQLSSGEQQLLLLFCYILIARDTPSVFMIDEPEISLNIKWQRQLIQTLLEITKDSKIQFIFASHSMEILAQHRSKVVKLDSKP